MTRPMNSRAIASTPGLSPSATAAISVLAAALLLTITRTPAQAGENPPAPDVPPEIPAPTESDLALKSGPGRGYPASPVMDFGARTIANARIFTFQVPRVTG